MKRYFLFAGILLLIVIGLFLWIEPLSVAVAQPLRQRESTPTPAANEFSEIMSRRFSGSGWASNTTVLLIAGCVVAGFVGVLVLVDRYYRNRNTKNGYYSRNRLFRELCQSHEFTNDQQTILKSISKELQLKDPALLFIEPKHLKLAMDEPVVHYPQESLRQIFGELFSSDMVSIGSPQDDNNSWFAWTKVRDNPEADQLKREPKQVWSRPEVSPSSVEFSETQQWDPALWKDVQRAVQGKSQEKNTIDSSATEFFLPDHSPPPVFQPPPAPNRTDQEKTGYKPRYPETQDALVHQSAGGQVSSNPGGQKTFLPLSKAPPSPGAQILSSMLYSVSDVTNELAYSSIRNHLTRSLSLSPQTLGEMKQRTPHAILPNTSSISNPVIPLDEIMISPQKQAQKQPQQSETQTRLEAKTEPKVAIRQIELKSIGLKPPKPFLAE